MNPLFTPLIGDVTGVKNSDIDKWYHSVYFISDVGIVRHIDGDFFTLINDIVVPEWIMPYQPPYGTAHTVGNIPIVRSFSANYKKGSTTYYGETREWIWPERLQFRERSFFRPGFIPLCKYDGLIGDIPIRNGDVHIGVEIELESVDPQTMCNGWNKVEDHSLKNYGAEFTTHPIKAKFLQVHLENLFSSQRAPFTVSNRCSVHIHLNIRDLSSKQIKEFLKLYCLYERFLYIVSGDRRLNNFCVPYYFNPYVVDRFITTGDFSIIKGRYAGLNMFSYEKFGTAEFRMHEGTTDVNQIIYFVNLIICLKMAVCNKTEFDNPRKIFGEWYTPDIENHMNFPFYHYLQGTL